MKALILAAGLGSRLQQKTKNLPKALVTVAGRPILDYQIQSLISNNINEIVIVVGKEGDKIINFISTYYPELICKFTWNREYNETNSAYSFWLAREFVKNDQYIHICCDILFSNSFLEKLISSKRDNIIAIRTDILLADNMENIVLKKGRISKMSNKNTRDAMGKAYGLAKFSPNATECLIERIEKYVSLGNKNKHCYGVIRELLSDINYYGLDAENELLMEVNTLSDFKNINSILTKAIQ